MPHAKAPFCRCSNERQGFKDREEDIQFLRKATLLREYGETGNLMVVVLVGVGMTELWQYSTTHLGLHPAEPLILEDKEASLLKWAPLPANDIPASIMPLSS